MRGGSSTGRGGKGRRRWGLRFGFRDVVSAMRREREVGKADEKNKKTKIRA
jgi:hypothetical protein